MVCAAGVVALIPVLFCGAAGTALLAEDSGPVSARAHTMGDDALWLGHAWVDGRHGQADLNALVARLKTTGIRDLFVHSGPLSDNGSLDAALRPRARWLTSALHQALPRVRVQAGWAPWSAGATSTWRTPRPGPASSPAPRPSSRMASTASTWISNRSPTATPVT